MSFRSMVLRKVSAPTEQGGPIAPCSATAMPVAASDALKAAGDILKVSTGLATGALVFSVGLLPNAWTYTPSIRGFLILSWFSLLGFRLPAERRCGAPGLYLHVQFQPHKGGGYHYTD